MTRREIAFSEALSLNEENTKRYRPYHGYLLTAKRGDEAMHLSRECILRDPSDTEAYRSYFHVAAYTQRTEEALEFLRNMLAFDRKDPVIFMALGALLMQHGQESAARTFYEISVHLEQHRSQPDLTPLDPKLAQLLYTAEGHVETLLDDVVNFARNALLGSAVSSQKSLAPPSE